MKRQRLAIFAILLGSILLLFFTEAESGATQQHTTPFRSYLKLGIEKAINLEFHDANLYLQKALEMDPENPTAYAYRSMIDLLAYKMGFDENMRQNHQASMLRYADEALARGEKRIKKNRQDSQAYFAMAMAKTTKVDWAIQQKHYFTMVNETSNIWEYLGKARENDPQNYDLYFLTGLLHYHIGHLPGLTRFLSSLIITSGNRQQGLQELELAAQKGDLLKQLALAELSSDYLNFEKQPERALPIILELKGKFPNNYNFSFALGNALADLHRFEDALTLAREIDRNIQTGLPPFVPQLQPRYYQLMGRIYFRQGDYARAQENLQKALQNTWPYNARVRSRAFLLLGMISDVRKERKQAETYYVEALDVKGGEGAAQIEAKKYLETPFTLPPKN
jgi:tetratricopeptide (TPR) repeat protein